VNMMLRSGTATREDKGKLTKEDAGIRKETCLGARKSFTKVSTPSSKDQPVPERDPLMLTTFLRCMHGSSRPSYFSVIQSSSFPNLICTMRLQPHQSSKVPSCVPHQCSGVACNAHFNASNHWCSGTALSNLVRNSSTNVSPSYIRSSQCRALTQFNDLVIILQFNIVTPFN